MTGKFYTYRVNCGERWGEIEVTAGFPMNKDELVAVREALIAALTGDKRAVARHLRSVDL